MTGETGSKEQLHGGRVEGVLAKPRHDKSRCNVETRARKWRKNKILARKSRRIPAGSAPQRDESRTEPTEAALRDAALARHALMNADAELADRPYLLEMWSGFL